MVDDIPGQTGPRAHLGVEPGRDLLIARPDAFARGLNGDDIKRRLARGEWRSIRRGVYARTAMVAGLSPEELHRLRIEAALPELGARYVVSHRSAACVHGLALLRPPGRAVQVTDPGVRSGRRRAQLQAFCAALDQDEITVVDGCPVTTIARTVVDLARSCGFEQAVVAADHALRAGLVDRAALQEAAGRAHGRRGSRTAQQVVAFADPRAESVGESRSRVLLAREGLPPPELQAPIRAGAGVVVARTDFCWRAARVVGEFDGAEKFGRRLRPGQGAGDAVFREKLREDRIRALGFSVVRWTWAELDDPAALAGKIARALDRGRMLAR
ncbi:hypothetical protein [Nakamurella sp.]|uniref:hypothetical protein n=1 Tax=Nakamurella sp. TaxID=1869182 RepID=UPI003B3BCD83